MVTHAPQIAARIESLGGAIGSSANNDSSQVFVAAPMVNIDEAGWKTAGASLRLIHPSGSRFDRPGGRIGSQNGTSQPSFSDGMSK